jgi:hypothetical protein
MNPAKNSLMRTALPEGYGKTPIGLKEFFCIEQNCGETV